MFLGVNWEKIFSLSFWLEARPGDLSSRFELIFLLVLIVGYGFYLFSEKIEKKLLLAKNFPYADFWHRFARMFLVLAISFTFIFFFRAEGVPILGGRYWFLLWLVLAFVWCINLLRFYYKELPAKLKKREAKLKQGAKK